MRRVLLSIGMSCAIAAAYAIPAKPSLISYVQPDGTEVEVRMAGDEHGHVVFSEDNMLVVDKDGYLVYASFKEGPRPVATEYVLGKVDLTPTQKASLQTERQISDWVAKVMDGRKERYAPSGRDNAIDANSESESARPYAMSGADGSWHVPRNFTLRETSFKSITGSPKALVLLVEYADISFTYGDYDYFYRMLNEEGFSDYGSLGSVRDYFEYNSKGKFTPDFDVYGPVVLPNDRAYYGANNFRGNDLNPHMMAVHALEILDEEVDFSQYDNDGDGIIDNVFIFYAGQGEHDSSIDDAVWPHSYDLKYADPSNEYYFDNVLLDHYACTCEHPTKKERPDGIGTFIHEFSHVMGLPDLYSTSYTSYTYTPGEFQVLDMGPYNNEGLTPPNYSSYERCALGWMRMLPMQEGFNELPELTQSNVAYAIPTERENEFYFFENRQQIGNDQFIPGHGMLVWHIDYDPMVWMQNAVNNTPSHQYMDLIEADNRKVNGTRNGDPFPGVKNITEFGPATKPALVSWDDNSLIFELIDITESENGLITLTANALVTDIPPYYDPDSEDDAVEGLVPEHTDHGVWYDLTGRKVANPDKGFYIVDGRKVMVR